jgi:hypothetical protein
MSVMSVFEERTFFTDITRSMVAMNPLAVTSKIANAAVKLAIAAPN